MTAQPAVLGPGQGWQFWISASHGTVKVEFGKGHFSIDESPAGRDRRRISTEATSRSGL